MRNILDFNIYQKQKYSLNTVTPLFFDKGGDTTIMKRRIVVNKKRPERASIFRDNKKIGGLILTQDGATLFGMNEETNDLKKIARFKLPTGEQVDLLKLKCNRCGYEWVPRKNELPQHCPGCNSPYWNKERRK